MEGGSVRLFLALLAWALASCWSPGAAAADDSGSVADPSEALAQEAHQVLIDHCADAAGGAVTTAAESVAVVSDVWARVSAEVESSHKVYLLYWRGVLAQCLDQEERAIADLKTFVRVRGDSTLWAGLVQDAEKRLRQLERVAGRGGPVVSPFLGLGIGLGAGSLAFGIGSAAAWAESQRIMNNEVYPKGLSGDDLLRSIQNGLSAADASRALGGAAVATGVGSAVFLVLHFAAPQGSSTVALRRGGPIVQPTAQGVVLGWTGRW